jgi:Helix-loop-helix DNA-binding domain
MCNIVMLTMGISSHPIEQLAPEKTPHKVFKKRYRAGINDKIAALRDSVPNLRVMDKHSPCSGDFTEDLQGLSLVQKLNKVFIHLHLHPHSLSSILTLFFLHRFRRATDDFPQSTILSKAAEYIAYLERRNKCLTKENQAFQARIDDFDILIIARSSSESTDRAVAEARQFRQPNPN